MDQNRFTSLRRPCAQSGDDKRGHQAELLPETARQSHQEEASTPQPYHVPILESRGARLGWWRTCMLIAIQGWGGAMCGLVYPYISVGNDDTLVAS